MAARQFPKDFVWGTAMAAYQIEGAAAEDGKGPSIWDTFSHMPGKILDGSTGDVACDHYHRYPDDFALMRELGIKHYRFSLSWPRLFPQGRGAFNQKGADFYSRLLDSMLENGITPYATLYHWDLPQALQDKGGWYTRHTAQAFAEFAAKAAALYGDRIAHWITLNEPVVSYSNGHLWGEHAPGHSRRLAGTGTIHNLLLAHGLGVQAIRGVRGSLKIGLTNAIWPFYSLQPGQQKALARARDFMALFLHPVFKGRYPDSYQWPVRLLTRGYRESDLQVIAQPLDFIGLNVYSRGVTGKNFSLFYPEKQGPRTAPAQNYTEMGWEIYPEAMHDLLVWVKEEYGNPPVMITENGAAFIDTLNPDGTVHDTRRQAFLQGYIAQMHRALKAGCDVRGYFLWSFLDNFEWAYGYSKRFGIVYVDYPTQRRVVKDSGHWYGRLCRENRLEG